MKRTLLSTITCLLSLMAMGQTITSPDGKLSVGWGDGAPTPKFRLNKPEDREKEFACVIQTGM